MKTRTWMTMLLASLITAGWAHQAGAQPGLAPIPESEETDEPGTRRKVEYYGWQILLTDAASVAAGLAAGGDDFNRGVAVFGTGYVLGGPIVHLGHGHPGRALGSLVLRAGLPALGAWALFGPEPECHSDDDENGFCGEDAFASAVGGIAIGALGLTLASLLDWTVLGLSIEEVPVEPGLTLTPQVSAGADGSLQLGVLGRF